MPHLITTIGDVTPPWLTVVLQRHGAHEHTVQSIKVTRIHDEQLHSINYCFEACWSPDAPAALPKRFFLKLPRQPDDDGIDSAGAREVAMYQFLASFQDALPVIPCYDAVYDPNQRRYHLLLADLSYSHDQPSWHFTIEEAYVQRTIDCLAQLHAYWWERPKSCEAIATRPTAEQIAAELRAVQTTLPHFLAACTTSLTADDQQLCRRLVAAAPYLWRRRLTPSPATLVHGDAHFWNFLYPRPEHGNRTYILDWQQQHIDWGVSDLAYMLVLRYPHRTQANEFSLVQRYYQALVLHGVSTYTWSQCWADYRRAAVEQALIPMYWFAVGLPESLWQLILPRSIVAYRELNGDALLAEQAT